MAKHPLTLLSAFFLLMFIAFPLYGYGKQQRTLKQADALIARRDYREAIHLLTDLVRDNQGARGKAQERFDLIIARMRAYNKVANTLLDTVRDTPGDTDTIMNLSGRLNSLGAARTPEARLVIYNISDAARLSVRKGELERVFTEAKAQLDVKDYLGAVNTYAAGLNIYQSEFFQSGYGEDITDPVHATLLRIRADTRALAAPTKAAGEAAASLSLPKGDAAVLEEIDRVLKSQSASLKRLLAIRKSFAQSVRYLAAQQAALPEFKPPLEGRYYLQFVLTIMEGRPQARTPEGLLRAADGSWQTLMSPLSAAYLAILEKRWREVTQAQKRSGYAGALRALANFDGSEELGEQLAAFWNEAGSGTAAFPSRYAALRREKSDLEKTITEKTAAYRKEGEQFHKAARAALEAGEFERAKANLETARARYSAYFDLAGPAVPRQEVESSLRILGAEITRCLNATDNANRRAAQASLAAAEQAGAPFADKSSEEEYQRAVYELQSKNPLIALGIVQRLLLNPANHGSTRLAELLRRIQAQL